ncbi:hypothetical protein TNCV_4874471 [Trichonephila clavipes]|nr:hypothetical protein TNCV_4874471 [Trichonephila clavipes]
MKFNFSAVLLRKWDRKMSRHRVLPISMFNGAYSLTARHRAAWRKWVAEHRDWIQSDWSQVLFKDEYRFSLKCNTRRVLDNARNHAARLVENLLEARPIQRMRWSASSRDLNLIQYT